MTREILLSGFGGQGILFTGKFLAYQGLLADKNVSWLPSYGPEMRGGTASCSVIISDEPVGSPIISEPDILIAMNLPSFEKFVPTVKKGGIVIADSSLIEAKTDRDDIDAYYIPATGLASDMGKQSLANMIILGKLLSVLGEFDEENIKATLQKVIPPKKAEMLEINMNAIKIGAQN
ncbi:MAG: 2-oxoacid:acceptor oxidoreductase family protein [Clostridia bacterium]|nr:2-oxoacid:acceptor oxidoreductase family protein [Clostridia bacterium]